MSAASLSQALGFAYSVRLQWATPTLKWTCRHPCILSSPVRCSPEQEVWYGKGPAQDYEMANYWDTNFKMNTFGMDIEEVCTAHMDSWRFSVSSVPPSYPSL